MLMDLAKCLWVWRLVWDGVTSMVIIPVVTTSSSWSIMTTLKVNQNFGFLVENVDSLCWLAHESKWIFMPLFVDENALLIPFLCYFSFFLPGSFIVSVLK